MDDRPKIIGIRDGTSQAWTTKEFWLVHQELKAFIKDAHDYMAGNKPNFDAKWIGITLDKDAYLTDFIDVAGVLRGYFVSDRLKTILESCHLPEHCFYKVVLHQPEKRGKTLKHIDGYWWFYYQMETGQTNVNFSQSAFQASRHPVLDQFGSTSILSFEDYKNIYTNTPPAPKAIKLVFNENFDKALDFWGTQFLSIRNYISENLHRKLEESKITGYKVKAPECELIFD